MRALQTIAISALLHRAAYAAKLVDPVSKDNSPDCECYLTSGEDPGYFQYHRFWDFRDVPSDDNGGDFTVAPAFVGADTDQGKEQVTSSYFASESWQRDWAIQAGPKGSAVRVPAVNTPQNVYISRNSTVDADSATFLTLRASRLPDFMSVSEIYSNQDNVKYSSIRARLRVIPNGLSNESAPFAGSRTLINEEAGSDASHPIDDGAVFGFFTYQSDTQESDMEILTYDPTSQIHYTNQPEYDEDTDELIDDASTDASMPNDAQFTEWHDHRIDWFDGMSRWYIDDELVLEKAVNVPTEESRLILNLWGDGGNWSHNMTVGGQVTVGIEWIQMVFNVSDNANQKRGRFSKRQAEVCEIGCWIDKDDGVDRVGFPELAFDSTPCSDD